MSKNLIDNRDYDSMVIEQIINPIVDKEVYTKSFDCTIRYDDVHTQIAGVDVQILSGNTFLDVDEKCSYYRVNEFQGTFAMSLSQINRDGVRRDDWFLNSTLLTDTYSLIYVDKAPNQDYKTLTKDGIKLLTVYIVPKDRIVNYFNSKGQTEEVIRNTIQYMIDNDIESIGNIYKDGYKYSYQKKYRERTINLLIPRTEIEKICTFKKELKR